MTRTGWWPQLRERLRTANRRLLAALLCYLVLILAAVFLLDGFLRFMVLFLFAILVVKTIAHAEDSD